MTSNRTVALVAAAVLALGGAATQVMVAQRLVSAGAATLPVAVFGGAFAFAAVGLHSVARPVTRRFGWIATGCALAVGAGAWALLPAAWFAAGVGWRTRGTAAGSCAGWYVVGVGVGLGWWWGFVGLH